MLVVRRSRKIDKMLLLENRKIDYLRFAFESRKVDYLSCLQFRAAKSIVYRVCGSRTQTIILRI